jgi:hypothetical protein
MARYFQSFPTISYDVYGNGNPIAIRNVFFRLKIIDAVRQNTLIYYPYFVKEGETPEMISYKYYKDSNMHWLVMLVNQVIDPIFDWPLTELSFQNYIAAKYGSIGAAQSLIDHYTLTVTSVDSASGDTTVTTTTIDLTTFNNTPEFTFQEVNLQDGTTVQITTTTAIVFAFDKEYQCNENRKQIQLLSNQYTSEIQQEFNALTAAARSS